jgi:hypothetical protein
MPMENLLATIDAEIARLQQARVLIVGTGPTKVSRKGATTARSKSTGQKRTLSPEARKRIADAQRRRWAAHKKAKTV